MVVTTWHGLTAGREALRGPVRLAIGTFDGVHRGHREILRRLAAGAAAGVRRAVLTFRQHPRAVLAGEHPGTLTTLRQRRERFAALGVTDLILIDFSVQFSRLSGREFIAALLRVTELRKLVVGVDFRCGRGRDTDVVELRRLLSPAGVPVAVVPPVMAGGGTENGSAAVSSTRIRAAVRAGDFAAAHEMMGLPFEVDLRGAGTAGTIRRVGTIRREAGRRAGSTCRATANGAAAYVAAGPLEQILPPPGTYAASAVVAGGGTVAAEVEVAADGVRCAWPANLPCAPEVLRFHRQLETRRDIPRYRRSKEHWLSTQSK